MLIQGKWVEFAEWVDLAVVAIRHAKFRTKFSYFGGGYPDREVLDAICSGMLSVSEDPQMELVPPSPTL